MSRGEERTSRLAAAEGERAHAKDPTLAGVSGAVSVLVFTWVHDLTISDIWEMVIPMLVIGILCGVSVRWAYRRVVPVDNLRTWALFNLLLVVSIGALGLLSALVFDPITTLAEVMAVGGPLPPEMLGRALPLTLAVTVAAAVGVTALFGWSWRRFGPMAVSMALVMMTLGMNLSAVGLVEFATGDSYAPVLGFFSLVVILDVVYAIILSVLGAGRRRVARTPA